MGQHKLLMEWRGRTVIEAVLDTWCECPLAEVVVVVRQDDLALQKVLSRAGGRVHVVLAQSPPRDMKASLVLGFESIESRHAITDCDYCFVAPADLVEFKCDVIERMVRETEHVSGVPVMVPMFGSKAGHPILLSWPVVRQVATLDEDAGLDQLVKRLPPHAVHFSPADYRKDFDTPSEYAAMVVRFGAGSSEIDTSS
ncbi:MobA-like NTP transferase domain protein [Rubripirellula tenax]|uniref:MobA-like NTP transferase domain protein n=2 Tax=Rubripirellula tenax TaxID=2528015 RepID=A0A5C6EFA3_9BACT|nr:MobA-like NTP transferase domain protein [Rubripirellula tenax]